MSAAAAPDVFTNRTIMENDNESPTASADGVEAMALVLGPVFLAAMMLITAAAFAGGKTEPPVAVAVQSGAFVGQN